MSTINNDFSPHLEKLQRIVQQSIEEEKSIMDNLLHPPKEMLTQGQKLSDRIAQFGGSWTFIIAFFTLLIIWILFNTLGPTTNKFDPYPFILMNLILSCIAALQAPIIMMSQNRQEEKDRKRSENDYMINLRAELEIRALHQKVDMLLQEQIKVLFEIQAKQLAQLERIENKLSEE
jgi:uncharacterized membrane protein